ncbi:hypothetical protein PGB90_008482 [Kerria lacca]
MNKELEELCEFFENLNKTENNDKQEEIFNNLENYVSLEDVEKFDEFIKNNNGHTGGWDSADHNMFLKLSKKHNLRSVIYLLRLKLPDISEEQIIKHDKWYKEYIKLKNAQQRTLRFWRLKKTADQNNEKNLQSITSVKIAPKKDQNIKLKIEKWKEYKNKIKAEKEKSLQKKMERERMQQEIKQIIHENKKKMIMQYKKEKEQEFNALKMARTLEAKKKQKSIAKRANEMLPSYRTKDLKLLQKVQTQKLTASQMVQKKEDLLRKLAWKYRKNISVDRDPVRLFIPTVEWKQKIKKSQQTVSEFPNTKPINIINIPHLAIPQWRRKTN